MKTIYITFRTRPTGIYGLGFNMIMNYIAGVVERARSYGDEELYRAIIYGDF